METVLSKELYLISKVSHYFSKDIVLLFELISLLSEPISLRFLCFVTLRNELFRKGILLQMARHTQSANDVIRNSRCFQNLHKSGAEKKYLGYKRFEKLYLQNGIAFTCCAISFKTIDLF